jgi:transcriptional regulator with XRE-family HTH domain
MNPSIELAQRIRRCRRRLGETQEAFAARFKVKRLSVINWEKGTIPNEEHMPELTKLLNTEMLTEREPDLGTYQFLLPFEPPLGIAIRISPKYADTIHLDLKIKTKVG